MSKICDMPINTVLQIFKTSNGNKIEIKPYATRRGFYIVTDVEPKNLSYPKGWYYAKGYFQNKHTSTTGLYNEIPMIKTNGESWETTATYCTL